MIKIVDFLFAVNHKRGLPASYFLNLIQTEFLNLPQNMAARYYFMYGCFIARRGIRSICDGFEAN